MGYFDGYLIIFNEFVDLSVSIWNIMETFELTSFNYRKNGQFLLWVLLMFVIVSCIFRNMINA